MQERRNFYRILQAQPDAPSQVIRSNYRTLVQKLRVHPDLGGSDEAAARLNLAYQTLRDPTRRAAYDRDLLARYSVQVLGQGGASGNAPACEVRPGGNRRNHYRMLQVQPDASPLIIGASYRALRAGADDEEAALLDAAYEVLADPDRRQAYDVGTQDADGSLDDSSTPSSGALAVAPERTILAPGADALGEYQPLITAYCAYCMTPHGRDQASLGDDAVCAECDSPLKAPHARDAPGEGRDAIRLVHDQQVDVRLYWLGPLVSARLCDWSPHGALIECPAPLAVGDVIRLESEVLRAVAKVVHRQAHDATVRVGLQFLATRFQRPEGNFICAEA